MARQMNWPIPFMQKLQLQVGNEISIRGALSGDTFTINLLMGSDGSNPDRADCAFHISTRLHEKAFVMNAQWGGQWGPEEVVEMKKDLKLEKEQEVHFVVKVLDGKFEVHMNKHKLHDFVFRAKLDTVSHLYINGAIQLHSIGVGPYPETPYSEPHDIVPGTTVCISGVVKGWGGKCFVINFKHGDDIALHLSCRFGEKTFVRNSFQGGVWGTEETDGAWNLAKKENSDIIIKCQDSGYEIFTEGQRLGFFAHRMPPGRFEVSVEGEINLEALHVQHSRGY